MLANRTEYNIDEIQDSVVNRKRVFTSISYGFPINYTISHLVTSAISIYFMVGHISFQKPLI